MKNLQKLYPKTLKGKILLFFVVATLYLLLYSISSPIYPEVFLSRSNQEVVTPTRTPSPVPTIAFENYKLPDEEQYFKDLAKEVAGDTVTAEVIKNEDGGVEVSMKVNVFGATRSELMRVVRRWIVNFNQEAFISPYDVRRVLIQISFGDSTKTDVEVSVGKKQVSLLENDELREMSPYEFCLWVEEHEVQEKTVPENSTYGVNYDCS